jgi:hypothetical protein
VDIKTLRALIDSVLDKGADGDEILLRACADILYERRSRLNQLERVAGG